MKPKVCIVIPNWNLKNILKKCLDSLERTTFKHEVIVVDNGSRDGSVEMVKTKFPRVHLICNKENLGYVIGNNQGIKFALKKFDPDYIVLANNDVEFIQKDWLKKLIQIAESDTKIGLVGTDAICPDGTLTLGPTSLNTFDYIFERPSELMEVEVAADCACLINRKVVDEIGLMDEGFSPISCEMEDYCLRMRASGFKIFRTMKAVVVHHGAKTSAMLEKDFTYFYRAKNKIRFALLNLPLRWIVLRFIMQLLVVFFGRKSEQSELSIRNIKFRKDFAKKLFLFTKAVMINLMNMREIIRKRRNRFMAVW